jgi:RNA polymerase sigma-70 factor, ECF subfamily
VSYASMTQMDEAIATLREQLAPAGTGSQRAPEFAAFFEAHHERLFRAMWLLTRNRAEAEELAQEAFLRLLERWDRVGRFPDPGAYLFRTAMNLWRSRLRRAEVAARRVVHQIPPDDQMADVEGRDAVVRALAALPRRQQAAVVLMDVLDLSSEQAGAILGVRAATVRVLVTRARMSLSTVMGGSDG